MARWIALLRGINVGGRHRLNMKDVVAVFEAAGCTGVRTFIQSGNVVFDIDGPCDGSFAASIVDAIEAGHGFRPAVHLLTADMLEDAIAANPFPDAAVEPKSLHLIFLSANPGRSGLARARKLATPTERLERVDRWLYLHAPDGIARSRLAQRMDAALGVDTTSRNWRTACRLAELAGEAC